MIKRVSRMVMALFFAAAGINHVISSTVYREIMPPYLPRPVELVYLSGIAEVLLGLGVLVPRFRKWAGWGLIALLCAVFPANVQMALQGFRAVPIWILWARLPLQFVMVGWVYWSCLTTEEQLTERSGKQGPVGKNPSPTIERK